MKATAAGTTDRRSSALTSERPRASYVAYAPDYRSPMPRDFLESPWYQEMLAAIRQVNAGYDQQVGTGRFFVASS